MFKVRRAFPHILAWSEFEKARIELEKQIELCRRLSESRCPEYRRHVNSTNSRINWTEFGPSGNIQAGQSGKNCSIHVVACSAAHRETRNRNQRKCECENLSESLQVHACCSRALCPKRQSVKPPKRRFEDERLAAFGIQKSAWLASCNTPRKSKKNWESNKAAS